MACRRDDIDRYGRIMGACALLATGEDPNAAMISSGRALAYRRYSTAYVADEVTARAARRGLWQGEFVPPWDYRAGERLARERQATVVGNSASAAAASTSGSCLIKGNISGSGQIEAILIGHPHAGMRFEDMNRVRKIVVGGTAFSMLYTVARETIWVIDVRDQRGLRSAETLQRYVVELRRAGGPAPEK